MVDAAGARTQPVRVTLHQRFDGLARLFARWKKTLLDERRTSDGKSQLFLADWNDEAARQAIGAGPSCAQRKKSEVGCLLPAISKTELGGNEVEWLADEKRDGRMTGTRVRRPPVTGWQITFKKRDSILRQGFRSGVRITSGERVLPDADAGGEIARGMEKQRQRPRSNPISATGLQ